MRAFVIQHIHFENLGNLSTALELTGFTVQYFDAMNAEHLNYIERVSCDLLIILGGPIGVNDYVQYPFLVTEKRLIETQLNLNKGVIGICLGCQLIASVLGANVYTGPYKEIGWSKVQVEDKLADNIYQNINRRHVLHWHGDTFDIPDGTERIASSKLYSNQGFRLSNNLLALQFHIEVQPHRIEEWLVGHACELSESKVNIQSIRDDTHRYAPELQKIAHVMWREWLEQFKHDYKNVERLLVN